MPRDGKIAKKGLLLIGLEEKELDKIAKGDQRKALVALAIKQETGVPLKWIVECLTMRVTTGSESICESINKTLSVAGTAKKA